MLRYKTILTIAGSDPVAGAGVQADLKTASGLGVYALTAITALTIQNSKGVSGVYPVAPEVLEQQLRAIIDDVEPDAIKIGMIPDEATAEVIVSFLKNNKNDKVVIDPVMTATMGGSLTGDGVTQNRFHKLITYASILTPNVSEAETLSGMTILSHDDIYEATQKIIHRYSPQAVLLKGGHLPDGQEVTDLLAYRRGGEIHFRKFSHSYITTSNTHGTGCTLSTAIACFLALGFSRSEAVEKGIDYLLGVLRAGAAYSWGRAGGYGPLNHFRN